MMARATVRERDNGYKELKKRWMNHKNHRGVVVGVFGEGADEEHDDGVTNLLVAIIAEFGAPSAGVPSRSWLRAWVDENRAELTARIRKLAKRVAAGKLEYDQALEQLGSWCVGSIQKRIANKIPPPLAPSTVEKRLASPSRKAAVKANVSRETNLTPLIDTGQFRQAITYEVRSK